MKPVGTSSDDDDGDDFDENNFFLSGFSNYRLLKIIIHVLIIMEQKHTDHWQLWDEQ